jgi:hypothetical protein
MASNASSAHTPRMTRRFVALALWTYFAWYLGAMLATFTGGPAVAGPIAAVLIAGVGLVGWVRSSRRVSGSNRLEAQPSR